MDKEISPVRINIKQNLKKLRDINDISMRDLSKALGIKENTYRVWEDTEKQSLPKQETLIEIAKIFRVSVDFLLRSTEENDRAQQPFSIRCEADSIYGDKYLNELSAQEKLAIMKFRRMSSKDKQRVEELIDLITSENE